MAMRYTRTAIALHWLMALAIVWQLALGLWMIDLPDEGGVQARWFNLHKSTGMVIFVLALVRLAWRASHPPPPWPAAMPAWKRHAAGVTHRLMYLCLLVAPLSGYLGSSFTKYPVRLFGYALPRWAAPWDAGKEFMSVVHLATVSLLGVLIVLHVGAAVVHAVRRDGVWGRMGVGVDPTPLRQARGRPNLPQRGRE